MSNKLELSWIGKNEIKEIEPRILIEQKDKSYGDINTKNMLIHADNLLALKALEKDFSGKIDCIYIDPPYNTGNAFESYDDGVEHSIWLNLMYERLKMLWRLLKDSGVICVQIDHSPNSKTTQSPELGYLQLLMDEVFGRKNYITNLIWKKKGNASNTAITIGTITESIFVYAKDKSKVKINKESFEKKYKYSDENGNYNLSKFLKTDSGDYKRDTMKFEIVDPETGKVYLPPEGKRWTYGKNSIDEFLKDGQLVFKGDSVYVKEYEKDESLKLYKNLLLEHGSLKSAKDELEALGFNREEFPTPKPENLIQEILNMFTSAGDLVLDSFLGSGTTAAVAHKMKRNWIGIEMGNHCYTYCKKRLDMVIDNKDLGGITKSVSWTGGEGYKYYELAPSLIKEDEFGEPIIDSNYDLEMLEKAVALHEGFNYAPDKDYFWKQSKGSEHCYLYVTTSFVSDILLDKIYSQMNDEFLVIAATSYDVNILNKYKNIKIKKIPEILLDRFEYGVNSYELNATDISEDEGDDDE